MALRTKTIRLGPTSSGGAFSIDVNLPGKVQAVGLAIGNLSTPDVAITDLLTGAGIFAKTGIAASGRWQPKIVAQGTDGDDLDTGGDVAYDAPTCFGNLHIVVAGGGDTKSGTLYVQVES